MRPLYKSAARVMFIAVNLYCPSLMIAQQTPQEIYPFSTHAGPPDNIDAGDLHLAVKIPLFDHQSRGGLLHLNEYMSFVQASAVDYDTTLKFGSPFWLRKSDLRTGALSFSIAEYDCGYFSPGQPYMSGGNLTATGYQFTDRNGIVHRLDLNWSSTVACGDGGRQGFDGNGLTVSGGYKIVYDVGGDAGDIWVIDPSGVRIALQSGGGFHLVAKDGGLVENTSSFNLAEASDYCLNRPPAPNGYVANTTAAPSVTLNTDLSGNMISVDSVYTTFVNPSDPNDYYDGYGVSTQHDNWGGSFTTAPPQQGFGSDIQYKDSSGSVRHTYINCSLFNLRGDFPANPYYSTDSTPSWVVYPTSVQYADGSAYRFTYEQSSYHDGAITGRLKSITIPTGATITYGYSGSLDQGWVPPSQATEHGTQVLTRTISGGGGTTVYSSAGEGANPYTTTITDPEGNDSVVTFGGTPYFGMLEVSRSMYQGSASSGNLLMSTTTCYNDSVENCFDSVYVNAGQGAITYTKVTTTLPSGAQSRIVSTYGIDNLLLERDMYEYGHDLSAISTPASREVNTFTSRGSSPYTRDNLKSESDLYDYGILEAKETRDYESRGLQTDDYRYMDSNNVGNHITITYSAYGMPQAVTDSRGVTIYSYDGTGAFVQSIVRKNLDLSDVNGVRHATSTSYSADTGLLMSSTDPNGFTTLFSYDEVGKLINVDEPVADGSVKGGYSICFHLYGQPAPSGCPARENASYAEIRRSASQTEQIETVFDSLGRVIKTEMSGSQAAGGSTGTSGSLIDIDTSYYSSGRPRTVSDPYVGAAAGQTSFVYDALGREVRRTLADGASRYWCYDGTAYSGQVGCAGSQFNTRSSVDAVDEAGKTTRTEYDSVGKLTDVYEDLRGANLHTTYIHTARGDLSRVDQIGNGQEVIRSRLFSYDWMSRLLTASNPESGVICYGVWNGSNCVSGYDGNGNLLAKTDARGVTASYLYDALNRVISRLFPAGTPNECWSYDKTANGVGRLTQQWTQTSPCGPSAGANALTSKTITQYDAIGQIKQEKQCVLTACTDDAALAFGYDLAGGVTTYNIPTARDLMTIRTGYNAIGWPNIFNTGVAGSQSPGANLLSITTFSPTGALSAGIAGTNLSVTKTYDLRLRPAGEVVRVK